MRPDAMARSADRLRKDKRALMNNRFYKSLTILPKKPKRPARHRESENRKSPIDEQPRYSKTGPCMLFVGEHLSKVDHIHMPHIDVIVTQRAI